MNFSANEILSPPLYISSPEGRSLGYRDAPKIQK